MKILTGHYVYKAPFTRNFERLGVFINKQSNARISNLSKNNPVPCERCLHPSEKVQETTSLGKSTGAYIPRKCKGAYIPRKSKGAYIPQKGTGAKSLGNVKGPTSPGKDTGAYISRKRYTGAYVPRKWRGSWIFLLSKPPSHAKVKSKYYYNLP